MSRKTRPRIDFASERYYTDPLDESGGGKALRVNAPASLFELKAGLLKLSMHIEELESAQGVLKAEIEASRSQIGEKVEILADTLPEKVEGVVVESEKRLLARQDAINARAAKIDSDLQLAHSILEGKIEGVRGTVASATSNMAEAVRNAVAGSNASLQADLVSEITDLGRMIIKAVREGGAAGGTPAIAETPREIQERLFVIEEVLKKHVKVEAGERTRREILDLLSIMDSFDRLLKILHETGADAESAWLVGVKGIRELFLNFLNRLGVERMEDVKTFDPNFHRAMGVVSDTSLENGAVRDVLLAGYMQSGMVLRVAEVVVNRLN